MTITHVANPKSNPVPVDLTKNSRYYSASIVQPITSAGEFHFNLSNISPAGSLGGTRHRLLGTLSDLTLLERGSLSRWKVSIINTHNQPAQVTIRPLMKATHNPNVWPDGNFLPLVKLFDSDASWLGATASASRGKYISSLDTGVNADNSETIAELDGMHQDLCITVKFDTAPTTGQIMIVIEAQG